MRSEGAAIVGEGKLKMNGHGIEKCIPERMDWEDESCGGDDETDGH